MTRPSLVLPATLALVALAAGCEKNVELQSTPASAVAAVEAAPEKITPNEGVEVALTFVDARRFNVVKGKQNFTLKDGLFSMTSADMTDSHFVSNPVELVAGHTYRIAAEMKGTGLASPKSPYAGGVGLYQTRMLIEAPTGSYDWRAVSSEFVVKMSGPASITVGLGGWKQASGTLEVRSLKLYR